MEIQITFHQMNSSEQIEHYVRQKLGKLEKFYNRVTDMRVVLEVNKLQHMVNVVAHLPQKATIKANASSDDMYASIDAVYDKLERQFTDWKEQQ